MNINPLILMFLGALTIFAMTGPLLVRKEKPTPRNFPFWKQAISIIGAVLGFVGVWLQIHSY